MDLTLSMDERSRLGAALAAVLSSPMRADDERWGRASAAALAALVGATSAVVVLQRGNAVRGFGDGVGGEMLRRVVQPPHPSPPTPPIDGRTAPLLRTRVWCRPTVPPPAADGIDVAAACGAARGPAPRLDAVSPGSWYDAVGITAGLGAPGVQASAACLHRHPQSADATARRLELLGLLLPAFASAARERLVAGTRHRHPARLLDPATGDALLTAADSGAIHESAALTRALGAAAERARRRDEIERSESRPGPETRS